LLLPAPQQTTVLFQEEVRRQKKAGEFSLTKQVYQPPLSPVDRTKLRNRYAIEKPNLKTKNSHSGVWEVGHDGRYVNNIPCEHCYPDCEHSVIENLNYLAEFDGKLYEIYSLAYNIASCI